MKASQASRCACSELNSCSSPSSEDLRVPCGAVEDAAAFELRGNAKDRKNDLGKIGRGIEERLGQRTDARPGLLHLAGDDQKVGRVTRQAVNCRDDHHVAGGELGYQFLKLWPVGGRAGQLYPGTPVRTRP